MISNFFKMPGFLKFLTAMAILCIFFIISTMLPGSINIHGHLVSTREWWSNGSGYVFAIPFLLLGASGVLMLKRAVYSRFVYIAGWIFSDISVFAVMKINNVTLPLRVEYAYACFGGASIVVFAIYLYFGKRVRTYFDSTEI